MRKLDFVHYRTPLHLLMVTEAFERGGFFDEQPEWCTMRNGVFILEDKASGRYVIIVCSNNNGRTIWQ